jgi:hypothetical protein
MIESLAERVDYYPFRSQLLLSTWLNLFAPPLLSLLTHFFSKALPDCFHEHQRKNIHEVQVSLLSVCIKE